MHMCRCPKKCKFILVSWPIYAAGPQAHYGFSRQPRHNPLICEVIANHYTVGFNSSDINTWPQRTARPTLPQSLAFYLSPTFYMSLEKRVIKSAEIAWARTSNAVRQNTCIPVHWDKQRHDERWEGSLLCIWQGKRDILAAPKHTRKGIPLRPGTLIFHSKGVFTHSHIAFLLILCPKIPCRKILRAKSDKALLHIS